ncbi:MAG: glycosyl hydrolase family 18 protein [Mycoplasmatales bacterium]
MKKIITLLLIISLNAQVVPFNAFEKVSTNTQNVQMINPTDQVLVGYWYNKGSAVTTPPGFKLTEVNDAYNVVVVSFMNSTKKGQIPTFSPNKNIYKTDEEFKNDVQILNQEGKTVLLSIGGQKGQLIDLRPEQGAELAQHLLDVVEKYGFDGFDIDLEDNARDRFGNQLAITSAVKIVKNHFRKLGENFIVTLAPTASGLQLKRNNLNYFPYKTSGPKAKKTAQNPVVDNLKFFQQTNDAFENSNGLLHQTWNYPIVRIEKNKTNRAAYVPYLLALEGYYDWVNLQVYSQGDFELNGYIATKEKDRELFLQALILNITTGHSADWSTSFYRIPPEKLVIGLPASKNVSPKSYIQNPRQIEEVINYSRNLEGDLKGLMTW